MTAKAKTAVTVPAELLEAVRSAVAAGHAPSVVLCARARSRRVVASDPDDLRALDPQLVVITC